HVPPVVLPSPGIGGLEIDLFPCALSDIADPQVAGDPVERETPGVAEPVRPDLRSRVADRDERVVRGDGVRTVSGRPWCDPQDLSEERREGLTVALRVASAVAVTETDVAASVRAEHQLTAVGVAVGLRAEPHFTPT